MIRLIYSSRSLLADTALHPALVEIVGVARTRNAALGVTGALIHCRDRFAQVLEGPPRHVDALMSSIARDRRHADLAVLWRGPAGVRQFAQWTMTSAFVGDAGFVHRRILAAEAAPGDDNADALAALFAELTQRGGVVQ